MDYHRCESARGRRADAYRGSLGLEVEKKPSSAPRNTGTDSGATPFLRARSLVLAVAVIVAASTLVYLIPWRVASQDDWPRLVGLLDHWYYYTPLAYFMDAAIHDGEFPLWNPLTLCGLPFAANPQSGLLYPPNLIRSVLTFDPTPLKAHLGLALMLGFHIVVAGVGAFYFARDHKLSHGASFVVAFAFMFSAGFVRRATANLSITTVAWLPLLLFLERRAFAADSPRPKLCYTVGAGLIFGMGLLAGQPHLALLMGMTLTAYGIFYRCLNLTRDHFRTPLRVPKMLSWDLLVGVMIVGIGILIAAAMLLPTMEFAGLSERGQLSQQKADKPFSLIALYWLLSVYPGHGNQYNDFRLAGLGVSLLALAAVGHRNKRDVALFAALFVVFLDCSVAPSLPFGRLSIWLAPFPLSVLSRAMMWACFPLAMLAGFGVDGVAERWRTASKSWGQFALFAIVGAPMLIILFVNVNYFQYVPVSNLVVLASGLIFLTIVLSTCFPRHAATADATAPGETRPATHVAVARVVLWLLPALLLAELFLWTHHYIPYLLDWKGNNDGVASLAEPQTMWDDNYRETDPQPNEFLFGLDPSINGYDPLYIARSHHVLQSPPEYIRTLLPSKVRADSYRGNLFLKRAFWLASRYVEGPLPGPDTPFPPTTTVFLTDPPGDLPLTRVDRSNLPICSVSDRTERIGLADAPQLAAWTRPGESEEPSTCIDLPAFECPEGHSALNLRYTSDCEATITTVLRELPSAYVTFKSVLREPPSYYETFGKTMHINPTQGRELELDIPLPDFRRLEATLEIVPATADGRVQFTEAYLLTDLADEDDSIKILSRRANSVDLEVSDLPDYRILTFVDAQYPGWKAYLDGEETPIYLANDAFKSVLLPPGTHHVRFVFRPWRVYLGMLISTVTVLGSFGFLLLEWTRKRRSAVSDIPSCD